MIWISPSGLLLIFLLKISHKKQYIFKSIYRLLIIGINGKHTLSNKLDLINLYKYVTNTSLKALLTKSITPAYTLELLKKF